MPKIKTIAEETVRYIRDNREYLEIKYPGFFVVFRGAIVEKKCKTRQEALEYCGGEKCYIIWKFDPRPERAADQLLFSDEEFKQCRKRELNNYRKRKEYQRNREKILARQAKDRKENPEKYKRVQKKIVA